MDKEIYKYMKDEEVIGKLASEIIEAFKTKMNKDTIDYSFDIAKGTGKIKVVEPNTFFNFDTEDGTTLEKFKKALFSDDLEGLTQNEENMLIEDVSEFLKEVATEIIEKYEQEIRDTLRTNIMPKSSPKDFPFERIFITSIDIADWSSIPESQKHLLRIGKKPGAFINTDVVITYVQSKQEDTGLSVEEIFEEEKTEKNPLFEDIVSIDQGDRYLYDITVTLFVDYSLAEKSMEVLNAIKETSESKLSQKEIDAELNRVKDGIVSQTHKIKDYLEKNNYEESE